MVHCRIPTPCLAGNHLMDDTVKLLLEGDTRALSRLISLIERGDRRGMAALEEVYPHTGRGYCIGVTGPPGAGKSTIVDRLAEVARAEGQSVGIIAVDPTSPFSGGAFLGDRIRMQRHYLDSGVFIRSLASRDGPGGLPKIVRGTVRLLDASGKDVIMVETVGVGQAELGIMGVADTVVVVLTPEAGDAIQTLKAGLMEIAHIYAINKADRQGADQMLVAVKSMPRMNPVADGWDPPALATQAYDNVGMPELYREIQRHREFMEGTSLLEKERQDRKGEEFLATIEEELGRKLRQLIASDPDLAGVLEEVKSGGKDPYSTALKLVEDGSSLLEGLPLVSKR